MDSFRTRSTATIVLSTVLACSFIPGLHHLGPFLLHTSAYSLERTARILDHLAGESPTPPTNDAD